MIKKKYLLPTQHFTKNINEFEKRLKAYLTEVNLN